MEPIRQVMAKVNHFSVVRFERNRYSVPVDYVGSDVTVKASVFEVSIWHEGNGSLLTFAATMRML